MTTPTIPDPSLTNGSITTRCIQIAQTLAGPPHPSPNQVAAALALHNRRADAPKRIRTNEAPTRLCDDPPVRHDQDRVAATPEFRHRRAR